VGSVDHAVADVPEPARGALQHVVDLARSLAPDAVDGVSYGMPALKVAGKGYVAVVAAADHLSVFPFSSGAVDAVRDRLDGWSLSRGFHPSGAPAKRPTPTERCEGGAMTGIRSAASQAGNNPLVERGARLGYAASGLLHLLIAWVVLQLAWTGTGQSADQSGAFQTLAGSGLGRALLWVTVVGFAALGLWQITEAVARRDTGDRVKAAGKAVVDLVLAWTALSVVRGSGGSGAGSGGSGGGEGVTATLMSSTGGRILVALVGLGVLGVGGYHVVKGWTERFLRDLRDDPGRWPVLAGRIGYVGKGVALAVVGALLVVAAVRSDPQQAQGLDAALRTVADLPLGTALLTLIALGFAAFGVYSFARARHARV
jgi:hypothetical protein